MEPPVPGHPALTDTIGAQLSYQVFSDGPESDSWLGEGDLGL